MIKQRDLLVCSSRWIWSRLLHCYHFTSQLPINQLCRPWKCTQKVKSLNSLPTITRIATICYYIVLSDKLLPNFEFHAVQSSPQPPPLPSSPLLSSNLDKHHPDWKCIYPHLRLKGRRIGRRRTRAMVAVQPLQEIGQRHTIAPEQLEQPQILLLLHRASQSREENM